jgi:hypothetical protein
VTIIRHSILTYIVLNGISLTNFASSLSPYRDKHVVLLICAEPLSNIDVNNVWIDHYVSHENKWIFLGVMFMVFYTTFNNISVISWQSVLLVKVPGENHWPVVSHWQTLSCNVWPRVGFKLIAVVVIGSDCIPVGNYHMITITTVPKLNGL